MRRLPRDDRGLQGSLGPRRSKVVRQERSVPAMAFEGICAICLRFALPLGPLVTIRTARHPPLHGIASAESTLPKCTVHQRTRQWKAVGVLESMSACLQVRGVAREAPHAASALVQLRTVRGPPRIRTASCTMQQWVLITTRHQRHTGSWTHRQYWRLAVVGPAHWQTPYHKFRLRVCCIKSGPCATKPALTHRDWWQDRQQVADALYHWKGACTEYTLRT